VTMTVNGVSTTTGLGQEQYEKFSHRGRTNKIGTRYQYDYRHTDGELFSCIRPTLKACREARDAWLDDKKNGVILPEF
jgi:hypothetical protein